MLPRTLKDFMLYYWRFDPKRWMLFMAQDVVHFSRYAMAYICVGIAVDALIHATPAAGIPHRAWMAAGGIFLALGIGESSHIWTAYLLRKWKPRLRARIRKDFFDYALGHSHAYFQDHFAGALARKVTEIAESCYRLHDHVRFSIYGSGIQMVVATVTLFLVSPWYGLGLMVFIASVTLPVFLRLDKISLRARRFSEIRAEVSGSIVDILSNSMSMRNFARLPFEQTVHDARTDEERRADSQRILTLIQIENYRRLSLVLLGSGMMVALLAGWHAGIVSIGQVSTVMGLSFSLIGATWFFGFGVIMMTDELGYIDDAIRMLTPPHGVQDATGAKDLVVPAGHIVFENVDFKFGQRPIFSKLELDIRPGEKIGLLGPSGAGKSTLVNLLLRLHDLEDGRILIDGQDIAGVTQESLRAAIALIPQDTALFHRSLRDNIRYGLLDATEEEIAEAARKAHAHEFIGTLPDGYGTMVGERGIKLSGGQRQRIAIARAILKNAPILLLDEATSALDSESEKMIQDSLRTLMEGKTVIAIAHRLSTIAHMDRLIVMDEGAIVEEGPHSRLVSAGGLYARLWSMQSGGFLGAEGL